MCDVAYEGVPQCFQQVWTVVGKVTSSSRQTAWGLSWLHHLPMGLWPKFLSFLSLAGASLVQWGHKLEWQPEGGEEGQWWEILGGRHWWTVCLENENLVLNPLSWVAMGKIVGFGEGKHHSVILLRLWRIYRVTEITSILLLAKAIFVSSVLFSKHRF